MKLPAWITAAATALGAALLPACDLLNLPRIKPGLSTAAEVRARLGAPGAQYANDDGSVTWEYSRQPNGIHCYMITVGADQIVQKFEQVLNAANFARVRAGMRQDEVRRLLGAPASRVVYDNLREEIWEWRIEGTPPMEETYFMVRFASGDGRVKTTGQRVQLKG